jgi:hypothetical protein
MMGTEGPITQEKIWELLVTIKEENATNFKSLQDTIVHLQMRLQEIEGENIILKSRITALEVAQRSRNLIVGGPGTAQLAPEETPIAVIKRIGEGVGLKNIESDIDRAMWLGADGKQNNQSSIFSREGEVLFDKCNQDERHN